MRYTDPDGRADIVDGDSPSEFTKFVQQTGHIIESPALNYSGRAEDSKVNQIVRFKPVAEKLDSFASIIGDTTGALGSSFEQFGKPWHITSSVPNQWVYPLPTLPDPDIMRTSQNLNDISTFFLFFGLALNVYDGIYTGVENHSVWRGVYRSVGNFAATGAGYFVGGLVTSLLTSGSFGTAAVPGVIAGAAAGTGTSKGVNWLFKKGEEWIWGN